MKYFLKLTGSTLFAMVLASCSTTHQLPQFEHSGEHSAQANAHQQTLNQLKNWRAQGKMRITIAGETHSASFDWQQFKANYSINFFGPFGYGSTWLRRTTRGVTLQAPERPTLSAPDPETLLLQALGWQVPVSDLQYWILGRVSPQSSPLPATSAPAPNEAKTQDITWQALPSGALSQLAQQGWALSFSRHRQYGELWLPGKVVATRDEASLLIIIKQWQPK